MSKLCNVLLCILLLLSFATVAFAADGAVTLQTSTQSLKPGETFTVTASLSNSEKIALGNVSLEFDARVFELTEGQCLVKGAMFGLVTPEEQAGLFLLMLPKVVSGDVFTFVLKVKEDAPTGEYSIGADAAIGTENGEEIPVNGTQVTVGNSSEATQEPQQTQPAPTELPTETTTQQDLTTPTSEQTLPVQTIIPEVTQPTASAAPESPASDGWILAGVAIVLCGAIVAAVILQKKKKA